MDYNLNKEDIKNTIDEILFKIVIEGFPENCKICGKPKQINSEDYMKVMCDSIMRELCNLHYDTNTRIFINNIIFIFMKNIPILSNITTITGDTIIPNYLDEIIIEFTKRNCSRFNL